jgi:ParB/Sulfiredoxin domain
MPKYQILKTYDYDRFILTNFNRDVKKYKKLFASMKKHGFIPPYAVHVTRETDGRLRIKEGHHRFEIAQRLHLPIYYIVCKYKASIQEMAESIRVWDLEDYLVSWSRCGKEAYLKVKEYWEETGISLCHCISMLAGFAAGNDTFREDFKGGTYRLGDPSHAAIVKDLVLHCRKMGIKWAGHSMFVAALSRVALAEGFDLRAMKRRMKANLFFIQKQPTLKEYINMLETVFNYHSREKVPLALNTEKAARERQAAGRFPKSEPAPKKSCSSGGLAVIPIASKTRKSTIGPYCE